MTFDFLGEEDQPNCGDPHELRGNGTNFTFIEPFLPEGALDQRLKLCRCEEGIGLPRRFSGNMQKEPRFVMQRVNLPLVLANY
jgi:hypothetical protein